MVSWRSLAFHNRKSRPGEREGAFARRRTEEGSTMPRSGRSTAGPRSAAERQPEPRPGWHGASARLGGDSTTRYDDAAAPTKKGPTAQALPGTPPAPPELPGADASLMTCGQGSVCRPSRGALGMHRRVSGSRVISGGDFTVTSHKSLVLQLCVFRQRVTSRGNVCD